MISSGVCSGIVEGCVGDADTTCVCEIALSRAGCLSFWTPILLDSLELPEYPRML